MFRMLCNSDFFWDPSNHSAEKDVYYENQNDRFPLGLYKLDLCLYGHKLWFSSLTLLDICHLYQMPRLILPETLVYKMLDPFAETLIHVLCLTLTTGLLQLFLFYR